MQFMKWLGRRRGWRVVECLTLNGSIALSNAAVIVPF